MGFTSSHLHNFKSVPESGKEIPLSILENVGLEMPISLQATSIEIFLVLRKAATSVFNFSELIIFNVSAKIQYSNQIKK